MHVALPAATGEPQLVYAIKLFMVFTVHLAGQHMEPAAGERGHARLAARRRRQAIAEHFSVCQQPCDSLA